MYRYKNIERNFIKDLENTKKVRLQSSPFLVGNSSVIKDMAKKVIPFELLDVIELDLNGNSVKKDTENKSKGNVQANENYSAVINDLIDLNRGDIIIIRSKPRIII